MPSLFDIFANALKPKQNYQSQKYIDIVDVEFTEIQDVEKIKQKQ